MQMAFGTWKPEVNSSELCFWSPDYRNAFFGTYATPIPLLNKNEAGFPNTEQVADGKYLYVFCD